MHRPLYTIFDDMAASYAANVTAEERVARELGLSWLDVRPNEEVLELGCGVGEDLAVMAAAGANVTALDAAPGMVEQSQDRLSTQRLVARLKRHVAPPLPVADDSLDAVWCSLTLELQPWPDVSLILREMARALRIGGRLAVVAVAKTWPDLKGVIQASHAGQSWRDLFFSADHDAVDWRTMLADHGFVIRSRDRSSLMSEPVDVLLAEWAGNVPPLPGIDSLLQGLRSKRPTERIQSRQRICLLGLKAVAPLSELAAKGNELQRAEAAKCLLWLGEQEATSTLVRLLEDPSQKVRWIAAEALVKLEAMDAVTERLTQPVTNAHRLYRSAGQVIRALHRRGAGELQPLVEAFEYDHAETAVPVVARQIRD